MVIHVVRNNGFLQATQSKHTALDETWAYRHLREKSSEYARDVVRCIPFFLPIKVLAKLAVRSQTTVS